MAVCVCYALQPNEGKNTWGVEIKNITPSHLSHPVDTLSALPSMAVGWCLHRLLRRKTKKQNSSDSPSMACAYATLFSPTKGKIHGVLTFNNIIPSHLSHPVDTFSALPSMAVGWCLHRLLRRKTKKQNSSDSPSMALCVCYAL
jgi:hypothetical protein